MPLLALLDCLRMASIVFSAITLSFGEANCHHCELRILFEHRAGSWILLEAFRPRDAWRPSKQSASRPNTFAVEDRLLVVAVLGEPLDLLTLDRELALVLLDAWPVTTRTSTTGPWDAGRHPAARCRARRRPSPPDDGAQSFSSGVIGLCPSRDPCRTGCAHGPRPITRCPPRRVLDRLFRHVFRDVRGALLSSLTSIGPRADAR